VVGPANRTSVPVVVPKGQYARKGQHRMPVGHQVRCVPHAMVQHPFVLPEPAANANPAHAVMDAGSRLTGNKAARRRQHTSVMRPMVSVGARCRSTSRLCCVRVCQPISYPRRLASLPDGKTLDHVIPGRFATSLLAIRLKPALKRVPKLARTSPCVARPN